MPKPKKPEPNPIEEAIGDRAKSDYAKKYIQPEQEQPTPSTLRDAPDQPLTQNEMVDLEELQRQTEARLQEEPEEETPGIILLEKTSLGDKLTTTTIVGAETPSSVPPEPTVIVTPKSPPVSKLDLQPATEHSSQESPPPQDETSIGALDELVKQEIPDVGGVLKDKLNADGPAQEYTQEDVEDAQKAIDEDSYARHQKACSPVEDNHEEHKKVFEETAAKADVSFCPPAEDKHLTALRNHIMDTGFVASGVAFHIVALCSQPMTTPTTTSWDFKDRASIPEMVHALLKQPGYIEGIWPSLKVVMADNRGNAVWTAGIATTIAFFDVIRTLPALKEMVNEKK